MASLRQMTPADIPAGLVLCRAAGWNQLARDWEIFLDQNPAGCFVAVEDDRVIGTVTTIRYSSGVAWLSMLLVDPAHRGGGIGTMLFEKALDVLSDVACVKLDATPQGRRIYQRYQFQDERRLWRMEGTGSGVFSSEARRAMPTIPFLEREYTWSLNESTISGRPGHLATQLGPISGDPEDARELVQHVMAQHPGQRFFIDAFEPVGWLEEIGFTPKRELIRMYRGSPHPDSPDKLAIVGPEFG